MAEARICPTCGELAVGPETHVCKEVRTVPARPGATPRVDDGPPTGPTGPTSGDVLAGRWVLVEKAGEGGGGTVFRAYDRQLDLTVALKVLAEGAASPEIVERLKREIRITRDVDHPRVSRVFDLGESGGRTFLTMRWIDGEPLSKRVRREGPLPPPVLARLTRGLVDALAAAHAAGVVHRDVKPANVMVAPDGDPVLVDFGIATDADRSLTRPRHGDRITPDGLIPGTPSFMSPEQLRGEWSGPPSDLYSLALTIAWATTGAAGRPAAPDKALAALPRPLRPLLVQCLEDDASKRPPSAVALATALARSEKRRRTVGLAIAAALLVSAALTAGALGSRRADGGRAVPLVAVDVLENETGAADLDWLEHGASDLVAAGLEATGSVRVATDAASRRRAATLGGRIVKRGGRVAIDLVLERPGVARVRTTIADATRDALFRGVDHAVADLTHALGASARRAPRTPVRRPVTDDFEAFRHYAKAQDLIRRHRAPAALEELRAAVRQDPSFALAQLERYVLVATGRHGPRAEADHAIEQARANADRLPPSRRELLEAVLEAVREGGGSDRFDRLRALLRSNAPDSSTYWLSSFVALPDRVVRRAILEEWAARLPDDPEAHNLLGYTLLRDFDERDAAERELGAYLRLAPAEPNAHDSFGDFLREVGRFPEALASYDRALEIDPAFIPAAVHAIDAAIQAGDLADADRRLERARAIVTPVSRDFVSWVYAHASVRLLAGDLPGALGRLDVVARAPETGSRAYVAREYEAIVRGLEGDADGARGAAAEADRLHRLYHGADAGLPTLAPYVQALAADRDADGAALARAADALVVLVPPQSTDRSDAARRALALALVRLRGGDPSGAAERLVLPPITAGEPSGAPLYALVVRARALAAAGRVGEVRAAWDEVAAHRREGTITPEVAWAWPTVERERAR